MPAPAKPASAPAARPVAEAPLEPQPVAQRKAAGPHDAATAETWPATGQPDLPDLPGADVEANAAIAQPPEGPVITGFEVAPAVIPPPPSMPPAHEVVAAGLASQPDQAETPPVAPVLPAAPDLPAEPDPQGRPEPQGRPDPQIDITEPLAERIGTQSILLKPRPQPDDEFAGDAAAFNNPGKTPAATAPLPDPRSGATARMLLDIMSQSASNVQPQERALAAATLLKLVPRMPLDALQVLSDRLCMMESPPAQLVKALIWHAETSVAGPLLEKCRTISDQDLLQLVSDVDISRLKMIARRRSVSPAVCDALIAWGETLVDLTLLRNPGAALSHEAFLQLCARAREQKVLQAPLATRSDTPPPVAFELFWWLPPELRRYVLSRFLTDSTTLDKILKIAVNVDETGIENGTGAAGGLDAGKLEELFCRIEQGNNDAAAALLARLAGIAVPAANRIISDPGGEPLAVALKAVAVTRSRFAAALEKWCQSPAASLRSDRNVTELQNIFDSLSFNKARTLLTYWDWAGRDQPGTIPAAA